MTTLIYEDNHFRLFINQYGSLILTLKKTFKSFRVNKEVKISELPHDARIALVRYLRNSRSE